MGSFRIFSKIRGDILIKVHHRYQRHRWQIIGRTSVCRHLKVNLKAKIYIYVNSTTQRCPNKLIKIFLIEDFFHLPPVSLTPVVHLELRISPRIFEKSLIGPNGILRGFKKTRSRKSRGTVPLSWTQTDKDDIRVFFSGGGGGGG